MAQYLTDNDIDNFRQLVYGYNLLSQPDQDKARCRLSTLSHYQCRSAALQYRGDNSKSYVIDNTVNIKDIDSFKSDKSDADLPSLFDYDVAPVNELHAYQKK